MPDEDHARFKRAIPPVVAEKAAELGAQLAEKQLEILAEQQKKVGEFVNKKVRPSSCVPESSNLIHTNLIPAIEISVATTSKSNWFRLRNQIRPTRIGIYTKSE